MSLRARLATSAAAAALAVAAIILAQGIASRHVRGDPGPQAFPVASAIVVALGAGLVAAAEARGRAAAAEPAGSSPASGVLAAATVGYLALLTVAGFVVPTALFLGAMSRYLDRPRRLATLTHILVAAGVALAAWYIFGRLFDVVLPTGPFGI